MISATTMASKYSLLAPFVDAQYVLSPSPGVSIPWSEETGTETSSAHSDTSSGESSLPFHTLMDISSRSEESNTDSTQFDIMSVTLAGPALLPDTSLFPPRRRAAQAALPRLQTSNLLDNLVDLHSGCAKYPNANFLCLISAYPFHPNNEMELEFKQKEPEYDQVRYAARHGMYRHEGDIKTYGRGMRTVDSMVRRLLQWYLVNGSRFVPRELRKFSPPAEKRHFAEMRKLIVPTPKKATPGEGATMFSVVWRS
jgi:hypothetical protein